VTSDLIQRDKVSLVLVGAARHCGSSLISARPSLGTSFQVQLYRAERPTPIELMHL
jgi:hypothetical protein